MRLDKKEKSRSWLRRCYDRLNRFLGEHLIPDQEPYRLFRRWKLKQGLRQAGGRVISMSVPVDRKERETFSIPELEELWREVCEEAGVSYHSLTYEHPSDPD